MKLFYIILLQVIILILSLFGNIAANAFDRLSPQVKYIIIAVAFVVMLIISLVIILKKINDEEKKENRPTNTDENKNA